MLKVCQNFSNRPLFPTGKSFPIHDPLCSSDNAQQRKLMLLIRWEGFYCSNFTIFSPVPLLFYRSSSKIVRQLWSSRIISIRLCPFFISLSLSPLSSSPLAAFFLFSHCKRPANKSLSANLPHSAFGPLHEAPGLIYDSTSRQHAYEVVHKAFRDLAFDFKLRESHSP